MKTEIGKEYYIYIILYSLAFGLILLNRGIYNDDWVYYNMKSSVVLDTYTQAGLTWFGYFQVFILSFSESILIYKIIIFQTFLGSGLLLDGILKNIREIESYDRIIIVLLFLLFPVNSARAMFTIVVYGICYFLFFLGFYLTIKNRIKNNVILRLFILIIFIMSFATQSLLLFFSLVVAYIIYSKKYKESVKIVLLKHVDYLLLPMVFWIIKTLYFKPYGLFEGLYHIEFKFNNIVTWISNALITSYTSFFQVLDLAFEGIGFSIIVSAIILSFFIHKKYIYSFTHKKEFVLVVFGIIAFFLGVIPYILVGKTPSLSDWNSRDQLLVPLGAAFILCYGIKIISSRFDINTHIRTFIYCLVIILCINLNFNTYLNYQIDWYKQVSIIENLKTNTEIQNHTTILFKDNTIDYNVNKRLYRFYEYTGMMKYAYGTENRFGDNIEFYNTHNISYYSVALTEHYNMKDYIINEPDLIVFINKGEYDISNKNRNTLRLLINELSNTNEFNKNIINIISLKTEDV